MRRTLILSLSLVAFLAAVAGGASGSSSPPASAAAACAVLSNEPGREYGGEIIKRTKISCRKAKKVLRRCGNRKKVKGWKLSRTQGGDIVFRRTSKRFQVRLAGAAPKCIATRFTTSGEG